MTQVPAEIRDELLSNVEFGSEDFTVEAWIRFDEGAMAQRVADWSHIVANHVDGEITWFQNGVRVVDPKPTYGMALRRKPRKMRI